MTGNLLPIHATVRSSCTQDMRETLDIEARYADGSKYVVAELDDDPKGEALAHFIVEALEARRAGKF